MDILCPDWVTRGTGSLEPSDGRTAAPAEDFSDKLEEGWDDIPALFFYLRFFSGVGVLVSPAM